LNPGRKALSVSLRGRRCEVHGSVSETQIGAAVEAVYDCALDRARWPEALQRIAGLFNSGFADSFARTHDRSQYRGIAHGLDADDYQSLFLDTWSQNNPWANRRPVTDAGEITSTREILPKDELLHTQMYHEYLAPRGLHEGMRLAIWAGPEGIEDVSLLRPWSMGPFGAGEKRLAATLMPHLRRSAAIARRLHAAETASSASIGALERVHQPVLLLTAEGRVVHANAAARRLLQAGDGLVLSGGRLSGSTAPATAELEAVLRRAAGRNGRKLSGTVALPRPSGKPALALIALPLNRELDWMLAQQPVVLACVADPAGRAAIGLDHLSRLFGLTPAEAALARDLLEGDDLAAIAVRTGRSVHTVRTHLARVMAKTGTTRQSELVRLLMALPRAD